MKNGLAPFARTFNPTAVAIALLLLVPSLLAQRPGLDSSSQRSIRWHLDASWSSRAELADGQPRGDIALTQTRIGASKRIALNSDAGLTLGLEAQWLNLDSSQDQGLPDTLHGNAAVVNFDYRLSAPWRMLLMTRPGVFADSTTLNSDTVNVPFALAFAFTPVSTLTWQFGLRYDRFSDYELIPLAAVRWQFDPDWSLNIGYPRSGVFWLFSQELTLDLHFAMIGGNFRTTREYTPAGLPFSRSTSDTYLDIREIRTGVGVEKQLGSGINLRFEAGFVTDRKFEYYERDINLNGKPAGYLSMSITGAF